MRIDNNVVHVQVHESGRLRAALAAALRVGNAVNQGTHLGGAAAVRLESLLKMADLRAWPTYPHACITCCFCNLAVYSRLDGCHAGGKVPRQQRGRSSGASRSCAGGPSHEDIARLCGLGCAGICTWLICCARQHWQACSSGAQRCSSSPKHRLLATGAADCWGRCKAS